MVINLVILVLTFYLIGRLLKSKLAPSARFSVRWGKAYLVACLAISVYLLIVAGKEYVLFNAIYEEMIEVENIPVGQVFTAIISSTLWPAVYGFLFGPLVMAITSWNRPLQSADET